MEPDQRADVGLEAQVHGEFGLLAVRAHVAAAVGTFSADCLSCLEDGRVLDRRGGGLGGMRDDGDKG